MGNIMLRITVWSLILVFWLSMPSVGSATEMVGMRSLQSGPVGYGPSYSRMKQAHWELFGGFDSVFGSWSSGGAEIDAESSRIRGGGGAGVQLNDSFAFAGWGEIVSHQFDASGPDTTSENSSMLNYRFSAGPVLNLNGLILGGSVGIEGYGDERREIVTQAGKQSFDAGATFVPVMHLLSGVRAEGFALTFGIKVFNQATAATSATDESGKEYNFKLMRRSAAEGQMDALIRLDEHIELGASLTSVRAGQASPRVNEYSLQFAADGKRDTGAQRDKDHVELGFGGAYHVDESLSFLAGLRYVEPSYAEAKYASLEGENLGGLQIRVGVDRSVDTQRLFFNGAHQISERKTYDLENSTGTESSVDVEQGKWLLNAGLGVVF